MWRDSYYENNDGDEPPYATFADFKRELRDSFHVYDAVGKATKVLLNFQQKNQSTATYVSKFKSLANKAGQKDAETIGGVRHENNFPLLQQVFREGLRKSLLRLCLGQATLPRTMKEWYDLALQLDSQTDGEISHGRRERDPDAMDIDAVQTGEKKVRWAVGCRLSEAEKKEHWDANLCFYCHKPNHSARDYRTKQRDIRDGKLKQGNRRTAPAQNRDDRRAAIKALFSSCETEEERQEHYQFLTDEVDFQ